MTAYLLGLFTLPALWLAFVLAVRAYFRIEKWLDSRFGIEWDLKTSRDVEGISEYTLRHNIWWERSWGPVFAGGWYREEPKYMAAPVPKFNRWVGLGMTNGPCLIFYRKVVR